MRLNKASRTEEFLWMELKLLVLISDFLAASYFFVVDLGTKLSDSPATTYKCVGGASSKETEWTRRQHVSRGDRTKICSQPDSNLSRIIWWPNFISKPRLCFAQRDPSYREETKGSIVRTKKGKPEDTEESTGRVCSSRRSIGLCFPLIIHIISHFIINLTIFFIICERFQCRRRSCLSLVS